MNKEVYYGLTRFLANSEMPDTIEQGVQNIINRISHQYILIGHLLYHKETKRMVIPQHRMKEVLKLAHDHPMSGHLGIKNTIHKVAHYYFWPGMKTDIISYIARCDACQKRKMNKIHTIMKPAKIVPIPFYHVGIDVVGPLPVTLTGNRYVILAVDFFSKWVEAKAVPTADAQSITQFLYDNVICYHGVPRELTSDRGTEFVNELVIIMTKKFDIRHIRTTAYHPQGNGQTERMNRTLKDVLSKLITVKNLPWDQYLNSALFAMRTLRSESTKFSAFEILQGRIPRDPAVSEDIQGSDDSWENLVWEYTISHVNKLQIIRRDAADFIKRAQDRQKTDQDKKSNETSKPLRIGDQVLLYRSSQETNWSAKLEPKWDGPFFIQDIKGLAVRLRDPTGSILPSYIHKTKVKKYLTKNA